MPAVSVIMAAFNVAAYIGEAMESVLAQTFRDLELIVVDDGSTDDTPAIVHRIASRDERVRTLRRPNGGLSVARNDALRLASGDLFAILDSDDAWFPEYLATQLVVLNTRPDVDIVTTNAFLAGGPFSGRPARPFPDSRPDPTLAQILQDENSVFIMSVFRRRVYDRIGGFDETMRTNEDYDYWLRAAAAGFRFTRNDRPLARYRRRDDSLSADELRMLRGILRVYQKARSSLARQPEVAIVDRQIQRFEAELMGAEARQAIEIGNYELAIDRLAALHRERGGTALGLARLAARWAPGFLARAYRVRRRRLLQRSGTAVT